MNLKVHVTLNIFNFITFYSYSPLARVLFHNSSFFLQLPPRIFASSSKNIAKFPNGFEDDEAISKKKKFGQLICQLWCSFWEVAEFNFHHLLWHFMTFLRIIGSDIDINPKVHSEIVKYSKSVNDDSILFMSHAKMRLPAFPFPFTHSLKLKFKVFIKHCWMRDFNELFRVLMNLANTGEFAASHSSLFYHFIKQKFHYQQEMILLWFFFYFKNIIKN